MQYAYGAKTFMSNSGIFLARHNSLCLVVRAMVDFCCYNAACWKYMKITVALKKHASLNRIVKFPKHNKKRKEDRAK